MALTGLWLGMLGVAFTGIDCYVNWYASGAAMRARRAICQSDLAQIGKAMGIYANRYQGQFPPSVDTLLYLNLVQKGAFACPSTDTTVDDLQKDLQCCYVYVGGQDGRLAPQNVLMYELDNHAGQGGSVLFVDLDVKWIEPYSKVLELVEQTRRRLDSEGVIHGQKTR